MEAEPSTDIVADSEKELATILEHWGRSAPPRLLRRGKQKDLEIWIMARFLKYLMQSDCLKYPIRIIASEAPDFLFSEGEFLHKVEIVEAVEPFEQRDKTARAKEAEKYPDSVFPVMEFDDDLRCRHLKTCLTNALERKSTVPSDWVILIYANTEAVSFEDERKVAEWIAYMDLPKINAGTAYVLAGKHWHRL